MLSHCGTFKIRALSKTHDRVCREKLWECFRRYGVSGKFLVILQSLYLENSVISSREYWSQARLSVVSSVILTVHQWLSCGVEMKRCGVECGNLLIPGLLFADYTSLFNKDVKGLEQSLIIQRNAASGKRSNRVLHLLSKAI